jgi:3-dehydroquinate dehydratase II
LSKPVLIINGPNLNLLGIREPEKYGTLDLNDIETACIAYGSERGVSVECMQSNSESAIIEVIHAARGIYQAIIINAGAYSHTSIAIRDALAGVAIPFYEVHITNIHARETFRHHSHLSAIAVAVIAGLGLQGYLAALDAIAQK